MKNKFLLPFLFVSTLSFAQVRVGLLAGGNLVTQRFSPSDERKKISYLPAWHAGILLAVPVNEQFSLQPALYYQLRGYQAKGTLSEKRSTPVGANIVGYDVNGDFTESTKFHYIELPLNFSYVFGTDNFKITPYAGGYVSYALSAAITRAEKPLAFGYMLPAGYKDPPETKTTDFKFKKDEDEKVMTARRWDYGGQAGVALEFSNIFIRLQYSLGLADVYRVPEQITANQGFGMSIGFWIGGNSGGGGGLINSGTNTDYYYKKQGKKYPIKRRSLSKKSR